MTSQKSELLPRARQLRKEMTPQERKLWYMFLRTFRPKFYKQRIIGPFIVDFYCEAARLIIEVDGAQHYTEQGLAYDSERTAFLESLDLRVLRFTNREIDNGFATVCTKIRRAMDDFTKN